MLAIGKWAETLGKWIPKANPNYTYLLANREAVIILDQNDISVI